jgi:chlorophyllide a oxygenase
VQFTANAALSGFWNPYPIDMEFRPPCQTVSKIGLARPGEIMRNVSASDCQNHLVQYHWCLPSRPGHTRLLYRMSMDFMGWMRYVPGIQQLWKSVAGQVLGEDLVLVKGQQDRLERGGNTWANPVSYDKMAVRYRRWRNTVAEEGASVESQKPLRMNAGEMFSTDD